MSKSEAQKTVPVAQPVDPVATAAELSKRVAAHERTSALDGLFNNLGLKFIDEARFEGKVVNGLYLKAMDVDARAAFIQYIGDGNAFSNANVAELLRLTLCDKAGELLSEDEQFTDKPFREALFEKVHASRIEAFWQQSLELNGMAEQGEVEKKSGETKPSAST